jgi:uncharacterized protein YggT (Ycf19 family)
MVLVDFILNLVGLLLWVNWRSARFDPLAQSSPSSLVGTLRRAVPQRSWRWQFLVALAALLFLRGWLYWQIGSAVNWTPKLQLGTIAISFRSDFLARTVAFSVFSFGLMLLLFYLWLLLLSIVNGRATAWEPVQNLVRVHLGRIVRWPWALKLILPLILAALLWMALNPVLARWSIIPSARSTTHRLEQAGAIGLGVYLTWKYLIGAILALYLLNSYVYLGRHWFWNFVGVTGRNLLAPLRWLPLRLGKLDFTPLVGIALISLGAELAERGLTQLYAQLSL